MIILKVFGGLGNQMFQYAAARGIADINEPIRLDHRFYTENAIDTPMFAARRYELNRFQRLNGRDAPNWACNLILSHSKAWRRVRAILTGLLQYIHQPGSRYHSLAGQISKPLIYLDGYFQSEKYFRHKRAELLEEFCFPRLDEHNELLKRKIMACVNPVSVHIRRGDYLMPNIAGVHGLVPLSYYAQAIALLRSRLDSICLFVFSDDPEWAKKNLDSQGAEIVYVDQNSGADSWKDMALMSCCTHHIIANSSFSWWGAWLSRSPGMIFAPREWFCPGTEFEISDIIPPEWTVL